MFVDLTEICQKIDGYIKIHDRNYSSETLFRMLRRNWLCCLQNKNVSHKTFFCTNTKLRSLLNLGKPKGHINLLRIFQFLYENYWPCLT